MGENGNDSLERDAESEGEAGGVRVAGSDGERKNEDELSKSKHSKSVGEPLLVMSQAVCRVPMDGAPGERVLFDNVSLALGCGEIVDLTGPSGSGKSMLLTAMAQLNPHAHARLILNGASAETMSPEAWRSRVAYLPQRPILTGESVREAILLPFRLRVRTAHSGTGRSPVAVVLRTLHSLSSAKPERQTGESSQPREGLDGLRAEGSRAGSPMMPDDRALRTALDNAGLSEVGLDHDPQELSVGQQARVCLLRTLLTGPNVLLADEVDAGLDVENAERAGELLARAAAGGMAVLRVRHHESDGRAVRTFVLEHGELTEQPADAGEGLAVEAAEDAAAKGVASKGVGGARS